MAKQRNSKRLLKISDHPKLAELQAELKDVQAKLPAAKSELQEAERLMQAQEEAVEACERRILAGRDTDSSLAVEQERLLNLKRRHALAFHTAQDLDKLAAHLPAALEMAKQDAIAQVAQTRREDYAVALRDFRDKLAAAIEASRTVDQLAYEAHRELEAPGIHPRYHSGVLDAGDAGLLVPGAGIKNLSLHALNHPHSVAVNLLKEIDEHLADLPLMAERDKERRPRFEHARESAEREEERKQALMAEAERANRELYGF